MAVRHFYTDEARAQVAKLIAEIEAKSGAEVVVSVRDSSGHYRHTDLSFGFALAFASLLTFLFHPQPMRIDWYPLENLLAFVAGVSLSRLLSPLRRALTSRRLMRDNVARSARSAFVEQGVGRTRARTGVLVYVSLFERRAEIVADIGLDLASSEQELERIRLDLNRSLAGRFDQFLDALRALGAVLAELAPPQSGDVNELPDEVAL